MEFRTERDSLGEIRVPAAALYGAQTARALQNFTVSGRKPHAALVRGYLRIKDATAAANASTGALQTDQESRIRRAVAAILASEALWPELFPVDPYQAGAGTSLNMNINEVVANWANREAGQPLGANNPVHPNDHVNRSQSTNDTFPTAMRLALLDASRPLTEELRALAVAFEHKATAWRSVPKAGRTHLQDAVPVMLGQEFGAYAATCTRLAAWLESARGGLRDLGIGGSAAGSGLNVPRGFGGTVARLLEQATDERLAVAPNLFESMQSQAPVMVYSSMLRVFALELTRICNDLRLLASGPMTGLAELILPAVQPGSSIMPGKVNPSILEMANQTWFSVLGYDQAVAYCTQAGQLELNVMMPMMAYSLLEATQVATHTLGLLRGKCIDGLQANLGRLRYYFENTPQIATALSPKLGYERTADLVKAALQEHRSVLELVRERGLLTDAELTDLVDPVRLTGNLS